MIRDRGRRFTRRAAGFSAAGGLANPSAGGEGWREEVVFFQHGNVCNPSLRCGFVHVLQRVTLANNVWPILGAGRKAAGGHGRGHAAGVTA